MRQANYISHSYNGRPVLIISQKVRFASEFPEKLSHKDSSAQIDWFLQKLPLKKPFPFFSMAPFWSPLCGSPPLPCNMAWLPLWSWLRSKPNAELDDHQHETEKTFNGIQVLFCFLQKNAQGESLCMLCGHGTISKREEHSTFSIKHTCLRMKSSTQPEKTAFFPLAREQK